MTLNCFKNIIIHKYLLQGGFFFLNIGRMFNQEIIDKRRLLSGSRARSGRNGARSRRVGILPSDRMSRKELREHTKAGEVVITNMYEEILPYKEFMSKTDDEKIKLLTLWRENYSNKEIIQKCGFKSAQSYYNLVSRLKVPKKKDRTRRPMGEDTIRKEVEDKIRKEIEDSLHKETSAPLSGLHVDYNGEFTDSELEDIFTKLAFIPTISGKKYSLNLRISEIKE